MTAKGGAKGSGETFREKRPFNWVLSGVGLQWVTRERTGRPALERGETADEVSAVR